MKPFGTYIFVTYWSESVKEKTKFQVEILNIVLVIWLHFGELSWHPSLNTVCPA